MLYQYDIYIYHLYQQNYIHTKNRYTNISSYLISNLISNYTCNFYNVTIR